MIDDDLPPALRRGPKMLQKNMNSTYSSTAAGSASSKKTSTPESRNAPNIDSKEKDHSVHLTPAQIAQQMMDDDASKSRSGSYGQKEDKNEPEHLTPAQIAQQMMDEDSFKGRGEPQEEIGEPEHLKPAEIAKQIVEGHEPSLNNKYSGDETVGRGVSVPPLRDGIQSEASNHFRDFDYIVHNNDTQFVEVILKPQRELIYQKDTIMTFDNGIEFSTELSSHNPAPHGILGKMVSAGKAMTSANKVFVKKCKNTSFNPRSILFSGNFPGNIAVINLGHYRSIICRDTTLLCASESVLFSKPDSKENGDCKKIDGLKLLKLEGDGLVFLWFGGGVHKRTLAQNETINAYQTYVMARQSTVNLTLGTIVESGFAKVVESYTGPGDIWIQSNSFGNLKDKIVSSTMLAAKSLVSTDKKKK